MDGCNWNCELTHYPSNTGQPSKDSTCIPCLNDVKQYIAYTQFMTVSALLKKPVSIEEWMAAATFVK